jgi:hypothetical protein
MSHRVGPNYESRRVDDQGRLPRLSAVGQGQPAMKISSFPSLVGVTWVLSDGFCVRGYFGSERQARARRAEIKREQAKRMKPL